MRPAPLSERAEGGFALSVHILAASTFPGFSKALRGALSSLSLMAVSEILSGMFILFAFGFFPVIKELLHLRRAHVRWLLVMACFSGVAGPLLWFAALSHTSAVNAGFFAKSQLIILMVLAHVMLGEQFTRRHLIAALTMGAGILFIAYFDMRSTLSFGYGELLVIFASIAYGASSIIFRSKLHKSVSPHAVLLIRAMMAISVFFILSPFLSHPFIQELRSFPIFLIPSLIGFAFIGRFLNSVSFFVALQYLPVTAVSIVGALEVVGGTLFAHLYLGEQIAWYHYTGGGLIILGNILLEILGIHPSHRHLEAHLRQKVGQ